MALIAATFSPTSASAWRALCLAIMTTLLQACAGPSTFAYVANADSREISVLKLDRALGTLQTVQTMALSGVVMPLAISADKTRLYASLRSEPFGVASFSINPANGELTPQATAPLPDSMANIALDRSGRWLFGASYGGHKLSVSPIATDGAPAAATQVLATGKNAHAAVPDASNRFLFVPTLGSDQVMQWRFDAATGQLSPNTPAALATRPGAGARHLVLHPNGRHAYLLNELDAGIDLLDLDADAGTLAFRQSWSTLPPGFIGKPWAADLHLSPDGRYLVTSERTSSTLAIWAVQADSGALTLMGHQATEQQPRSFQIDPSGQWLVAVGQMSNTAALYRIHTATGQLALQSRAAVGKNPNWVEIIDLP